MENTKVPFSAWLTGCCLACLSGTSLWLCFQSLSELDWSHACAQSGPALFHVPAHLLVLLLCWDFITKLNLIIFSHPSVSSLLLGYHPSRATSQPGSAHCCMDTCPGLEKEMLHMAGLAGWGLRQVTGLDYDPVYLMILACISFPYLI